MKHVLTHIFSVFIIFSKLFLFNMAHAETIVLDKDINQFHESFTQNVNISGSVRAGVMYSSSLDKVRLDSLFIDIGDIAKSDKMLCVKMLSVDGQYGADFSYKLKGKLSGLNHFKLPTTLQDKVSGYTPSHLAVLAEIKPACKGKGGHIVPALWSKKKDNILKVYLNSGVSKTSLKLYKAQGGSNKVSCNPIKAKRNTAYDTECNINISEEYTLEKTKIIRTNFGSHSRPIKLPIYISQKNI